MLKISNILIPTEKILSCEYLKTLAASRLKIHERFIKDTKLLRKSIDARKKDINYNITLLVKLIGSENEQRYVGKNIEKYIPIPELIIKKTKMTPPVIVGFGPAGIFSALVLARAGVCPIIIEQGSDIEARHKHVKNFYENRILNPSNNLQFGEGGAGTFSDGKLSTGIKSDYIPFILKELISHGAPEEILYNAKPHIGTDLLSVVIKNIRQEIVSLGGKIMFNSKFNDFSFDLNKKVKSALYMNGETCNEIETDNIILAIGHSARDVYEFLYKKGVKISQKPFSAGVRIEHLQSDINLAMYGSKHKFLPPAEYKMAIHTAERGVYTFCMCPGGYVVPCSSETETVVTNGMSYHARDGFNANSALLVSVYPSDFPSSHPLAGIEFQRKIEKRAYIMAGKNYNAPVFMTGDFLGIKTTGNFSGPQATYQPSTSFVPLQDYLPEFICNALKEALPLFGKKIYGFDSPKSILTGPETRSSAPVRIERSQSLEAIGIDGLYPCGEGAGYAGGIISSAVDGINAANKILEKSKEL